MNHRAKATAAQIVRVQQAAYAVEAELIGYHGIPPLHERVDDVVTLDVTFMAIVDAADHILAVLGYERDDETVEIDRLAVDPDHFRRGFARQLLQHLHEQEHGTKRFVVSTGASNAPAKRLYESMGYAAIEDETLPQGVTVTRFMRSTLDG